MKYPAFAQEAGIQGRVYVKLVIEKNGSITNVEVEKSPHESLSKKAIRLVKSMPLWNPGKLDGKYVRTSYKLPLTFRL